MEIYSGKQKACGIIVLGLYEAPLFSREDLESSPFRFLEGLCLCQKVQSLQMFY